MSEEGIVGEEAEDLFDLDCSMDGIEEAPDFVLPEPGQHQFVVKSCKAKAKQIVLTFSLIQTIEAADEDAPLTPPGSLCSLSFQRTKVGLPYFKAKAKKLLTPEILKGMLISEVVAMLDSDEYQQAYSFTAVTRITKSKKDGNEYENLQLSKIKLIEV